MSELINKGDTVYLTAFLRKDKSSFYVCKGKVTEVLKTPIRFKVEIQAVGDKAWAGSKCTTRQKALLGLVVTKKKNELHKELNSIMAPKEWLIAEMKAS